jgi:DNA replication protein DnaC
MSQPERLDAMLRRIAETPEPVITPEQRTAREQWERERVEREAAEDRDQREAWKDEAGIPKRHRAARLEGARATAALRTVRAYLDGEDYRAGRCLILAGNTGCGKTYALCAGLDHLASQSRRARGWESLSLPNARFYFFPSLVAALMDSQRRADALWSAKSTQVLVLDDFGAAYLAAGGLAEALVEEILVEREAEMLATLISTNLTTEELRELSDRLVDRLGGEWGKVVSVAGPSLRQPARARGGLGSSGATAPAGPQARRIPPDPRGLLT